MGMKSSWKHFFSCRQSTSTEPILTFVAQFSGFRNTMEHFYALTSINQSLRESTTERVTLWYFIWRSKVNLMESMSISPPKPPKIQATAVSILVWKWKPDSGIVCRCLRGKHKSPQTTNSVITSWQHHSHTLILEKRKNSKPVIYGLLSQNTIMFRFTN